MNKTSLYGQKSYFNPYIFHNMGSKKSQTNLNIIMSGCFFHLSWAKITITICIRLWCIHIKLMVHNHRLYAWCSCCHAVTCVMPDVLSSKLSDMLIWLSCLRMVVLSQMLCLMVKLYLFFLSFFYLRLFLMLTSHCHWHNYIYALWSCCYSWCWLTLS